MKANLQSKLNSLQLSDIYSLLFFVLYKIQDLPEYATASELCYLLDGNNLIRLLTYFAGKTIKIPEEKDFLILIDALLLYQYVNVDKMSYFEAQNKITNLTAKQRKQMEALYIKLMPIISQYNIDRSQVSKYERS